MRDFRNTVGIRAENKQDEWGDVRHRRGYRAHSEHNPDREDPTRVIRQLVQVMNPTGHISLIGVYFPKHPGGVDQHAKKGEFRLPLGGLWNKGISIEMGQARVKRYNVFLRDMIISGRAKPSFIVSHRMPLSRAAEAIRPLRDEGCGTRREVYRSGAETCAG